MPFHILTVKSWEIRDHFCPVEFYLHSDDGVCRTFLHGGSNNNPPVFISLTAAHPILKI